VIVPTVSSAKPSEAVFEGPPASVAALVAFVRRGPPAARVEGVELADESPAGERGFAIRR
jgi:acylphosphatase